MDKEDVGGCMYVYVYTYAMEYYSAIKMKEIMLISATWMDLGIIILSEVTQRKINIYHLYVESSIKWYKWTYLQNTREDSTQGHHQMVNTEIRLIIFFAAKDGEALYSFCSIQQKQDQELTVAQIMNSLLPNSDLNGRK